MYSCVGQVFASAKGTTVTSSLFDRALHNIKIRLQALDTSPINHCLFAAEKILWTFDSYRASDNGFKNIKRS